MKKAIKIIILIYKSCISAYLPRSCRFHPTCSTYMLEAVEKHGAIKGTMMGVRRIAKCHPFNRAAPYDPVP